MSFQSDNNFASNCTAFTHFDAEAKHNTEAERTISSNCQEPLTVENC